MSDEIEYAGYIPIVYVAAYVLCGVLLVIFSLIVSWISGRWKKREDHITVIANSTDPISSEQAFIVINRNTGEVEDAWVLGANGERLNEPIRIFDDEDNIVWSNEDANIPAVQELQEECQGSGLSEAGETEGGELADTSCTDSRQQMGEPSDCQDVEGV